MATRSKMELEPESATGMKGKSHFGLWLTKIAIHWLGTGKAHCINACLTKDPDKQRDSSYKGVWVLFVGH